MISGFEKTFESLHFLFRKKNEEKEERMNFISTFQAKKLLAFEKFSSKAF